MEKFLFVLINNLQILVTHNSKLLLWYMFHVSRRLVCSALCIFGFWDTDFRSSTYVEHKLPWDSTQAEMLRKDA